jgi:hypothetical protein
MSQESTFGPNLAPSQGEVVLPDDPSFTEGCMSHFADAAQRFGWRFGKSILTRSSEWGLVWRVDFELASVPPGGDLGLVNRIVCWRKSEPEGVGSVPDDTKVFLVSGWTGSSDDCSLTELSQGAFVYLFSPHAGDERFDGAYDFEGSPPEHGMVGPPTRSWGFELRGWRGFRHNGHAGPAPGRACAGWTCKWTPLGA